MTAQERFRLAEQVNTSPPSPPHTVHSHTNCTTEISGTIIGQNLTLFQGVLQRGAFPEVFDTHTEVSIYMLS